MRRRWIVAGAAALVVVGLGTGGGVWAARYQPLERGAMSVGPSGGRQVQLDPTDPNAQATLLDYHDGSTASVGLTVTNTSHFTVQITGVEMPPADFVGLLRLGRARTDVPGRGMQFGDSGTVPFQPFDLHPGEVRLLFLDLRIGNCEWSSPNTTGMVSDVAVHYSFLGFDHRTEIPFDEPVEVAAPPAGGCPRPSRLPTH